VLEGVDQKIAPLLRSELPDDPDPRLFDITIGNLLSMQSGLARTSGLSYGRWISSDNWVRFVLERDFVADPGGRMLYSTGSTHLLSAILTRVTGRSTLELARDWLAPVEGFRIADWQRDPQGIYLGGNQMAMTPRSLLAFGELYRNEGRAGGQQVVPREWITESWRRRTRSPFNGEGYGYSWFVSQEAGFDVNYAWGFGGQMLYIVPELELTVVMTSDTTARSAGTGYGQALRGLLADIIAVAERKGEARAGGGEAEPAE
jgi:CubicO group peptidase (beta-lactamase class C family)